MNASEAQGNNRETTRTSRCNDTRDAPTVSRGHT